jgi:hypothetical protein
MKVFLMFRDRDFGPAKLSPLSTLLIQDLELETLLDAMAAGDAFLREVARDAVLQNLHEPAEVLYRQQIVADCLANPEIVRRIYGIAVEAIEREKKIWGWMSPRYPEGTLHRSVQVLRIFVGLLKELRKIAGAHLTGFRSEGFRQLFKMLAEELNDEYIREVEDHLERLAFHDGILMSAELGKGHKGTHYVLRKPWEIKQGWVERMQGWLGQVTGRDRFAYVYEVADRDEAGFSALSELRSYGIAHIAAALAQATDHILGFFNVLRLELGFYIGCLNLHERLSHKGESTCFPQPAAAGELRLAARGLYDVCLSLSMDEGVVGNDVTADGKNLVMITGANRGGKSTFLRSLGLAQVMMQCGMFVPATYFCANISRGVFTHFKREEDATMRSGKLDEELSRMSAIVGEITPNSVVLLNESFASTNEREGSEIAAQIVRALLESGVKVLYVTHIFDLARRFHSANLDSVLFLRAERLPDGQRTFRMIEGAPLPTSHGEDLYTRIFRPAHEDGTPELQDVAE